MQLQKSLIPDYEDEHSPNSQQSIDYMIYPGFRDIRSKTLRSLYGIEDEKDMSKVNHKLLVDKSPKGSVDEAIRSLVDLINAHPSYATLSSCSGRISLFDPNYANSKGLTKSDPLNPIEDEGVDVSKGSGISSGKGYGAWLMSSHATITPNELIKVLELHAETCGGYALIFKHEPLLLHIAASNMSRARQLLTIACNLGFRESGLMVTPKRITVAIRSHSLSLTVPIASSGSMRPDNSYLTQLVREANERFHRNEEKLNALKEEVQSNLFQSDSLQNVEKILFHIKGSPLPDLNLWGHSAISIPSHDNASDDVELIVIGGCGSGPVTMSQSQTSPSHCSRSSKVFSLKRKHKQWGSIWQEVRQEKGDDSEVTINGIKMKQVSFTAREGHTSSEFKINSNTSQNIPLIVTFGGRASPSRPFDDLLLTPAHQRPFRFFKPLDIRGDVPSARWGHSFVPLSENEGKVGILIGGRDEKCVFGCVHVLSYRKEIDFNNFEKTYLHWERLHLLESIPRFHHTSVLVPSSHPEEQKIIVFGGLKSLNLFDDVTNNDAGCEGFSTIILTQDNKVLVTSTTRSVLSFFGASTCLLSGNQLPKNKQLLLRIGGLPSNEQHVTESQSTLDLTIFDNDEIESSQKVSYESDERIDYSSLIHHATLETPLHDGTFNLVSLGGGVPSLAFGQSFAKSYALTIVNEGAKSIADLKRRKHHCYNEKGSSQAHLTTTNKSRPNCTNVVYVKNKKARELKVALQTLGFLDRTFRMTKADDSSPYNTSSGIIAVPITKSCLKILSESKHDDYMSWVSLIEGLGEQQMPFSTAIMGRS